MYEIMEFLRQSDESKQTKEQGYLNKRFHNNKNDDSNVLYNNSGCINCDNSLNRLFHHFINR